jgi:hypothetical protein
MVSKDEAIYKAAGYIADMAPAGIERRIVEWVDRKFPIVELELTNDAYDEDGSW